MKHGVRNALKATVTDVKTGDIMSQIKCQVKADGTISSILSTESLHDLDIKKGDEVLLLIKAIHVIPAKD